MGLQSGLTQSITANKMSFYNRGYSYEGKRKPPANPRFAGGVKGRTICCQTAGRVIRSASCTSVLFQLPVLLFSGSKAQEKQARSTDVLYFFDSYGQLLCSSYEQIIEQSNLDQQ